MQFKSLIEHERYVLQLNNYWTTHVYKKVRYHKTYSTSNCSQNL